jgi:hypothetical protein
VNDSRDDEARRGGGSSPLLEQSSSNRPSTPASQPPLPSVSFPKGGGAIRGIGEKFGVSAVTGTASLTIPVPSSPGRAGFGPTFALAYDSGSGNGPFGFGWNVGAQTITRKTDKGLPRYLDHEESDVFILSGAEDLVPVLDGGQRPTPPSRTVHGVTYQIYRYRPRIDSMFTRVERWVDTADGTSHFRTITRDNVTSWYGLDTTSRIFDPDDPRKIYSYLLVRTVDDRGQLVECTYLPEDERGLDLSSAHEANRTTAARATQRYVKSARYSHTAPYFASYGSEGSERPTPAAWHFELVFDYGDHAPDGPVATPDRAWSVRPDPFSTYRAGFEVRTYRRCHRILAFHHFPNEARVGNDCLVRALELAYADEACGGDPHAPIYTFIASITQASFRRADAGGAGYVRATMPPIEHHLPATGALDDATSAVLAHLEATKSYAVTGTMSAAGTASSAGVQVQIVNKNCGGDTVLATVTTDAAGAFRTTIAASAVIARKKRAPDLQARVVVGKKTLGTSIVRYNAGTTVQLDVALPATAVWTQAVGQGVIPSALAAQIPSAAAAFGKLSASHLLDAPPAGMSTLRALLTVSLGNNAQQLQLEAITRELGRVMRDRWT